MGHVSEGRRGPYQKQMLFKGGQVIRDSKLWYALKFSFQLQTEVTEQEVHDMVGVFSVHAATIDHKGFLGKALFPIFSMVNHDCIGNSKFQVTTGDTPYSQQPRVLLRASTDIAQGEEITVQVWQYGVPRTRFVD